ncbi:MAG: carboxypeptidase regulatory-like domain-containing protein [Gemmatimonadota bacterium]
MKMPMTAPLFGLLIILPFSPLRGQAIHGRVVVADDTLAAFGDTVGVDGATISLLDSRRRPLLQVQSDQTGRFRIPVEAPGTFLLSASRIGFRTVEAEVALGEREIVDVELRMAQEAVPLEPLIVTARREIRLGSLDEFYDRMDRNRERGVGQFLTREEVENSPAANTTLLLGSVPGLFLTPMEESGWFVQMRRQGDFCTPDYYLDGLITSPDRLPPLEDIEGVEIYRTRFENVEGYWPSDCGIVFMWRKRDWGEPFSFGKLFLAAGLFAVGWALTLIW